MRSINDLTKTSAAYIAGFLDGDGSIGVYERRPSGQMKNPTFDLKLSFAQSDRPFLEQLQQLIGAGSVQHARGESTIPRTRPGYILFLSSKQAEDLLRTIYPFLLNKKDQARIALLFRGTTTRAWYRGRHGLPQSMISLRRYYKEAIMALKMGRVIDLPSHLEHQERLVREYLEDKGQLDEYYV